MSELQMDDAFLQDGTDKEALFSEQEKEILNMYDQVQKLELEVALTKARVRLADNSSTNPNNNNNSSSSSTTPPPDAASHAARARLLDATALHSLRARVAANVLAANPVLRGVHGATLASPVEQDLAPWVAARDAAARGVAARAHARGAARARRAAAAADARRAVARNRALAAEVLALAAAAAREAEEAEARGAGGEDGGRGGRARALRAELEGALGRSRRRWRVLKGVASGIVAGSGVDWAADEELRAVVLDPE